MRTWVRKTLSIGVLAAGALLLAPGAAHADTKQHSWDNNGVLNGTQVVMPVAVPVNLVGNAIGVAGEGNAAGAGSNWWTEGGHGATQKSSDNNGIGNGTQLYAPIDVPVNVVGNAVGVLGEANAAGAGTNGRKAESARTESTQDSSDNNGVANGTQLYAPVDVPINLCGNGIALLGEANAQAMCANKGGHQAEGAKQTTSDNNGVLNGTQAYAPVSVPLNIAGNAIGVAGEANAAAAATNESGHTGGGVTQDSSDNNGIANGTQVAAPIRVPVNVCGNALSILGEANAAASCTNGGSHGGSDNTGGDNGDDDGYDDGDDVGGDNGMDDDGYTKGTDRKAHGKKAAEATAVDGLTQNLSNAGGLNVGGLDLLNTLGR